MRQLMARAWEAAETRELLQLRADGASWQAIGRRLGRSAPSCRNRLQRVDGRQRRHRHASANSCSACGMPRRGHICSMPTHAGEAEPPLVEEREAPDEYNNLLDLFVELPPEWFSAKYSVM